MQTTTNKPTYVTTPSLAPVEDFIELIKEVWASGILTHNGPMLRRLEAGLCEHLKVSHLSVNLNGTIALQIAIKALDLKGEIITTPFTWIATCSAIIWESCTPVFVDIDPDTLNLDPNKIEDAITHRTVGVMPVHVFSNPCDVEAIDSLAEKHQLKVIYDAAHSLCVDYKGKSLMEYGDISATSFHATKLFNTGEGGACITPNEELHERLKRIRFFGHNDTKDIVEDGCNGKMTEFHAAVGLANLPYIQQVMDRRKSIFDQYHQNLSSLDFIRFQKFDEASYNYSYMPIIFDSEAQLLRVDAALQKQNVFGRRYFYPSLNTIQAVKSYSPMPISEDIAKRIMCLPSHSQLTDETIQLISSTVKEA